VLSLEGRGVVRAGDCLHATKRPPDPGRSGVDEKLMTEAVRRDDPESQVMGAA
jgi:hypothetical protein